MTRQARRPTKSGGAYACTRDSHFLRLLKLSPFERRGERWRFGTKTISDPVIGRLIASGAAVSDGERLYLTTSGASQS